MASALMILFLGCWLAGQSGVSGGTGRAPPAAPHPRHTLGALVPGAAAVPADGRFHLTEGTESAETQQMDPPMMEPDEEEGTDSAGIQEPNPSMTEPEEEEGTNSAETQQMDPPTMDLDKRGTGRAHPAARHPRHALGALVPGAAAVPADARFHPTEGTNSAETQQPDPLPMDLDKREGTDPAGPQQPDPALTELDGEGGTDLTQPGQTSVPTRPDSTTPGGTNSTQLGTMPASTRPGTARPGTTTGGQKSSSNQLWKQTHPGSPRNWVAFLSTGTTKPPLRGTGGSEPSAAPGLTRPIIAGVSAAATGLLLLLLVAFVRYRRKGPAPRQTRESEPATTVYALMGEEKQLDVLSQKPDPSAEGHTYAELDGQALQAKQGGAAPAPEPPLYSTITMSQGPNGQSPQGAAEPPTDPDSVNPGGVTGETGQEASATTG